ncbi:MAG: 50S ribosomal protein L18 [Dehalococcoidia bacterium]|nr:50S ribosomal protein L18 [Dehalococcoidia bacterium]
MKRLARKRTRLLRRKHLIRPRPRLCVYRSLKHIYAQVIDDSKGETIASASSKDAEIKAKGEGKVKVASMVGELVGKRAIEKGLTEVVFDRRRYRYHGRVKALAEAARKAGLKF